MSAHCPGCGKAQTRLETDGMGGVVDIEAPCRCEYWRRVNRICRHCDKPVTGRKKVALYCDRHRKAARDRAVRKHLAKVGNAHQQRFYYRHRDEILTKLREVNARPEVIKEKAEYKQRWRKLNRDKTKEQKRRHTKRGKNAAAQRRYRAQVKAGIRVRKSTPRNARGERLCLGSGCKSVLEGRAKMCAYCKRAQALVQRSAAA